MKGFVLKKKNEIEYLQSPLLRQTGGVLHGFSTRKGGISEGVYASLNTGLKSGDSLSQVMENRRRFLEAMDLDLNYAVSGESVHGVLVTSVEGEDRGKGAYPGNSLSGADGLVTGCRQGVLTFYSADCLLLYLVDPEGRSIGMAHAGWRGVLEGMAYRLVREMAARYFASPPGLKAAVSPCICFSCFEVGDEVAEAFRARGWSSEEYLRRNPETGSFHVDLEEVTRRQFREAGLREENIDISRWCTSCYPSLFYSYRRDRGKTGRMMGFIVLE